MNYADKGIQVIDAKSDNFGSFKPSRTINCPQNDEFVQVCPLKVNTQNWLLVATQNGHVCLLDENYETVSSICLNLKLIDLKKEQINCMAVSPNSKNAIVSSQIYCNRAQKKSTFFWLEINSNNEIQLISTKNGLKKEGNFFFDTVKSMQFSWESTSQKAIVCMVGDNDFLSSYCLNRATREIEEFKLCNSKHKSARAYKLVSDNDGVMWTSDNRGNIVRFALRRKNFK